MPAFAISAILGIGSSLIAASQANKERERAEAADAAAKAELARIRADTRFDEETSALSVGASRTVTSSNALSSLQIGF